MQGKSSQEVIDLFIYSSQIRVQLKRCLDVPSSFNIAQELGLSRAEGIGMIR